MTDRELKKIYNESYRVVYWTAISLLKDSNDAEDVVQDTFVALIKSYDTIKDKTKVAAWLKKTAANKCLDQLRSARTDTVESEILENVEAVPDDFLPASIVESAETRKIVMDIIEKVLSDDMRRTLILFYFDEMSTKEIAMALGIPQGTVLWRLNFAKKKIKREVEEYEKSNNTKLFTMAQPFLTALFMKEAEQVPIKPMPASLKDLSASIKKRKGSQTITEGTEFMSKKGIIYVATGFVVAGVLMAVIFTLIKKAGDDGADVPVMISETTVEETTEIYTEKTMQSEITTGIVKNDGVVTAENLDKEEVIYVAMDGMSPDEMVENVWKTLHVHVGMTGDEYYDRFIIPDGVAVAGLNPLYSWYFDDITDSASYISMVNSCLNNVMIYDHEDDEYEEGEIIEITEDDYIDIFLCFEDLDLANEFLDKMIEKCESSQYTVMYDGLNDDEPETRFINLENGDYRCVLSLSKEGNEVTYIISIFGLRFTDY